MSDNQVQEQPTQETAAAPTPETQEQATPTPSMDLNSTVEVNGKQVPVSELISQAGQVDELKSFRSAASALMKGDTLPPVERENAMRHLLSAEGYSPAQIENYIVDSRELYEPSGEERYEERMDYPENEAQAPAPAPAPNVDEGARQQLEDMQRQNNQMQVDMLKTNLTNAMDKTMASNASIHTLMGKSKELAGEEGYASRVQGIKDEVQRIALDSMRQRRSRGEKFDKAWFDEETNKAADTVYQRIRSVIGDPDKIQRAPETASDAERFISKPPVATPQYEAGDNMGTVTDKSHDFTVDALSRLSADLGLGGDSKI